MFKKEFMEKFGEKGKFDTKAETERTLNSLLKTIEEVLVSGDEVNFIGWGKFKVTEKAARKARNLQTGKIIKVPAKKAIRFKAGTKLRENINKQ